MPPRLGAVKMAAKVCFGRPKGGGGEGGEALILQVIVLGVDDHQSSRANKYKPSALLRGIA